MLPNTNAQNATPYSSKGKAGNTGHKYPPKHELYGIVEFIGNAKVSTLTGTITTVPYMERRK